MDSRNGHDQSPRGDSGRRRDDNSGPPEGDTTASVRCFVVKVLTSLGKCRTKVCDDYDDAVDYMNKMMNRPQVEDARLWEL